jgi:hypothetical protein
VDVRHDDYYGYYTSYYNYYHKVPEKKPGKGGKPAAQQNPAPQPMVASAKKTGLDDGNY